MNLLPQFPFNTEIIKKTPSVGDYVFAETFASTRIGKITSEIKDEDSTWDIVIINNQKTFKSDVKYVITNSGYKRLKEYYKS